MLNTRTSQIKSQTIQARKADGCPHHINKTTEPIRSNDRLTKKRIKKEANNSKTKPSGHDIILQNQNHTKRSYRKGIKSKSPFLLWATEKKTNQDQKTR